MISKVTTFLLLLNLVTIFGSFEMYQPGDVIIGQLLPVYQSSSGSKCTKPDLASIVKVEALVYAASLLTKESDRLKVGYDIIDTCSKTKSRARLDFAGKRWFEETKNISRIPSAIITDLNDVGDFYFFASKRRSEGKDMPLISLKYREKTWVNPYSMKPKNNIPQRAILGLVQHFHWNILDIVHHNDPVGLMNFEVLSNDTGVCLLNHISFINGNLKWVKRGERDSPVAILFSKDGVSEFIDALPSYNLSDWNIILGHEVSQQKHHWAGNMMGVVGIRRNYGNLDDFEKYLRTSTLLENAVNITYCSNTTAAQCASNKDEVIRQNVHHGASVIDATYAVIKSLGTSSKRPPQPNLPGVRATSITGRVVSFDSEDLTRNEKVYDVLNFRQNNFVKVGKVEFSPKMKVTLSGLVWKNGSPQGRCSEDCQPGTWRDVTKEAGKCCWNCRACGLGNVSSNANSKRCVKCPDGTKPTSDQSKCQPPYVDYLKWYDPFSLIMIFLLVFTVCFLVYAVNIYVKKANTPVFLRSKSASLPVLLSLFVTFVLPILLLMKPTRSACEAYNALFMFSLGIPLTFLIVRSHVVLNYCYGDDGELKRKWFHCSPQTVISFILITVQLIIVVVILVVAPQEVLTLATPEPSVEYIECAAHSQPEFLPLVFFILVLIMAFNILHMNEECTPLNQNEVKFVSFGIYLMYTFIFVYFVAVFGVNGKKKIRVLCAMAYLMGVNFLATIFLPKIYVILFKPEENLPDVSHLLKDENGNKDASRLSKRECVESPLLGLQAGPYDRTEV